MLKNIKSSYINRFIFTFVNEKQKLELARYNKNLQKNINISIINYKHFTGRYIIYKSNKFGKEYDYEDNLRFEGEYLKGKRNGKGKEYNIFGYLEFEGEYLNGKRNGKGKEYYYDGKLKFEGRYLNNKEWVGTGYNRDEEVIYKLNNNTNGIGKEYDAHGKLKYEGEYLKGKRNGKGKEYALDLLIFKGEFKNDKRWNGRGYDSSHNTVYKLNNGKGLVKEYFEKNGELKFEGEYLNGERNGKGKEYNERGILRFEGEYLDGKRNGKGKDYNEDGKLFFEGEYLYDFKLRGKIYIWEKMEYEGGFLYNKKWNGKGYDEDGNIIYELINGNGKVKEYYDDNSSLKFEGEYLNGKKNGKGRDYFIHGMRNFEGEYLNGKRNGLGIEHDFLGKLSFEGEYLNGKRFKRRKYKFF